MLYKANCGLLCQSRSHQLKLGRLNVLKEPKSKSYGWIKSYGSSKSYGFKVVGNIALRLHAGDLMEVRLGNVALRFNWAAYTHAVEQRVTRT